MSDDKKIDLTELAKQLEKVAEGRCGGITGEQRDKLYAAIGVIGQLVWEAGK